MTILVAASQPDILSAALTARRWAITGSAPNVPAVTALLAAQDWQVVVVEVTLWESPADMVTSLAPSQVPIVACVPPDLAEEPRAELRQHFGHQLLGMVDWDERELRGSLPVLPVVAAQAAYAGGPDLGAGPQSPPPAGQGIPPGMPPAAPLPPQLTVPTPTPPLQLGPPAGGWRCVAVWSLEGGAGKTTTALALAHAAADRGIPVLLISLSAPDMVPIYTGLDPGTGLLDWQQMEGTAAALTQVLRIDGRVSHVTGPQDPSQLSEFILLSADPAMPGIPELVSQGALAGHSLVILDCGSADMATTALSTAMELIIPVSCTFRGAVLLTRALALAAPQQLKSVTVLLNRIRQGGMAPTKFQDQIKRAQTALLPDNWVMVRDDLEGIEGQHNVGGQPHRTSATLRTAAAALQELVYPLAAPEPPPPRRRGLFGLGRR